MNQTYFECYEFDVNFVRILIATCIHKSTIMYLSCFVINATKTTTKIVNINK